MARRSIDRSTSGEGNVIDMKTMKPVEVPAVPVICDRIRTCREKAGMEQKALAARIGITGNAISNWEKGRARPDISLIPGICEALGVTLYELFGMEDPGEQYTAQEKELIEKYRKINPVGRHLLRNMAQELLLVQGMENVPELCRLQFYQEALAAGIGDPTEIDEKAMPIYLYQDMFRRSAGKGVSRRAGCVFTVNGDSMEPDYHSGDLVLVERVPDAPKLTPGEIGAFIVGNETYIKQYREDGLVSLNPKYKVMRFENENRVFLIGRVLGTLDPKCVAAAQDIEKYRMLHPDGEETGRNADAAAGTETDIVCREYIDRYLR